MFYEEEKKKLVEEEKQPYLLQNNILNEHPSLMVSKLIKTQCLFHEDARKDVIFKNVIRKIRGFYLNKFTILTGFKYSKKDKQKD